MYLDLIDFFSIIGIIVALLAMSFSLYLPLKSLIKNKDIVLALIIPLSLSVIILLGYLFYSSPFIRFFPIFLLTLLLAVNVFFVIGQKFKKPKINIKKLCVYSIMSLPVLFTRFCDSIKNVGPGNNDTFNHIFFLKDLDRLGYISSSYYAPGLQLIFYPISKIISTSEIYRFGGPALGIIVFLSLFLIFRTFVKNKLVLILFVILACLPIYNQLTLQTISFFSSSLSFISFASLIYLFSLKPEAISWKLRLTFLSIITLALAITVPYLFVQLIPCQIAILAILHIARRKVDQKYIQIAKTGLAIFLLGLAVAFGHTLLQTKILSRGAAGFPSIPIVRPSGDIVSNNSPSANPDPIEVFLSHSDFSKNYLLPPYMTSKDILIIKNIRKPDNVLAIGSYLWIILSGALLYVSIKQKRYSLLIISVYSLFFGLVTQTGTLEMSFYRGRGGWYLLLLSLIGITILTDIYYVRLAKLRLGYLLIPLYSLCFLSPPVFYRWYYPEIYNYVYKIVVENKDQNSIFITSENQISLLSDKITVLPLKPDSLDKVDDKTSDYLILEKKYLLTDPVLSQKAYSTDKNYSGYYQEQEKTEKKFLETNDKIFTSPSFKYYEKYLDSNNVTFYIKK
jgi:hypothetical protein